MNVLSVLSTSAAVNVPEAVNTSLDSVRASVADDTVAASLVPVMVILTVEVVPSTEVTLNVSLTLSPTFRLSNASLAVNVQSPAASISKSPIVPVVELAVNVLSVLSTSAAVNVPDVLNAASVSVSASSTEETVAAS